jgi:hypothetical protein
MEGNNRNTQKEIIIEYTNADVLTNKLDELEGRVKNKWPHVIAVNEVKPKNMEGKKYKLSEFSFLKEKYEIYGNNIENKKGRGQIMYVDKMFRPDEVHLETVSDEILVVNLLDKDDKVTTMALVYRSPSSTPENNRKINQAIGELSKLRTNNLVIMGDFNHKEIVWETLEGKGDEQDEFIDCIVDNNLWQHVEENTRFRGTNKPSRLDLVFTSDEHLLENLVYESGLGKSDHAVLSFTIQGEAGQLEGERKRQYRRANITGITREFENANWIKILKIDQCDTIEEIIENFNRFYNEVMERNIPRSNGLIRELQRPPLDEKLKELLSNKDRTSRKSSKAWKETGSRYEYEKQRKEYNRARNKVRAYTRKLRKEYEMNMAKKAKEKVNEVWAYMKAKISDRKGIGKICLDPEDEKSETTEDDKEKVKVFSKFFISVQTNEPPGETPKISKKKLKYIMKRPEILEAKVLELLEQVNEDKAEGPDGVSPRVLKPLAKLLSKPITMIFKESLRRNKVPDGWKIAWITVIYKNGKRTMAGNYRPISLTSVLCKIMEKLIREPILDHMKKNGFFSNKQYGFIKGRSTVLQLLYAVESWMETMEKGNSVDCIYADFRKAFDKVPHRRLMEKVRSYGIEEGICDWLESFLSNRKQQVIINGQRSEEEDVISGVPQGSVLGPLLFIIFINDLPELVKAALFLFADDSKIWKEIEGQHDKVSLQEDLNAMEQWSKTWLLEFHPDKLKLIHMNIKHEEVESDYKVGEYTVKGVQKEKDLGVIVDKRLSFEQHITYIVKKANSTMAMIRRAFKFLDRDMFRLLFKGMVRNGLEYGGPVWSPYKMKEIERIEGVQRRATSRLPGMKNKTYEERLKELNLPTLRYRRTRGDMIETYKIMHGIYDNEVTPKLEMLKDKRGCSNIRGKNSLSLFQKRARLEMTRNSFTHRIVKVWNSLPEKVVMAPSVNAFKNELDREWKHKEARFNFRVGIMGKKDED